MKTVLYDNGLKNNGEKLKNMIHEKIPGLKIEKYNSIERVSQLLRQPLHNVSVLILIAASKNELVEFNAMNALFDNIRVILILPDRGKETLALGFRLKSSFVSYIDSDLQDVASVLGQILKKTKEKG